MDNSIKQRIIEFNKKFNLKTEFITGEDVLGYALKDTIYINESIEQDYEKTNKHELLHFYENTPEFKKLKQKLLIDHKEKIDKIRDEYELRYFGLYSEEEIKAGVLDNEIIIDLMVDNSTIEYSNGLKIGDMFLGQIQNSIEQKRYMNLTLNANIKNMNLSDWEKIFVLNYYDGKEHILPQVKGADKVQAIKEDIEKYLQELSELKESEMQINPHSPEVIREYESEIKALKARGEDTTYLESNPEKGYQEIAQRISKQLYEEYKHIVDLMKGLDYEPAFKSMMLRETLTKVYKLDRDVENEKEKTIIKNRNLNESIAGHMILNESTLKFIYKNIKEIDEYKNFANLYFAAVKIYKEVITKTSGITIEGVETFEKGEWLKFDGKGTDEENYIENSKKLAALVQDTPWCTKQLASSQLADGDFYVFVDNEGKPHIAVKTTGEEIDEVRGIKNGNTQELEEEYRDVAISFLERNKEIKNGQEWLEKEEWNKRIIEYNEKIDNGEFTIEDVPGLIEDYFKKDYRSHGYENPNKTNLKNKLKKVKSILAQYYECSEEEICVDDIIFRNTDLTMNPYKIIFGNADFRSSQITDLGQLQIIGGNVDFSYSQITDLDQLESIGGNADFSHSKITDLGQLQSIGGNVRFNRSKIKNLGQIQRIEGNVDFLGSQIADLGQLQKIGGDARFGASQITDLGQLQKIGGDAKFGNSHITDLGQLQIIGGRAYFSDSQITDLGRLQRIGASVDFSNTKITNLGQLQKIGRNAYFIKSKITDLGQLQSIGRNAFFSASQITDLGQLQSIGGNAVFEGSHITDLGRLQSICGEIIGSEDLKRKYELRRKKIERMKVSGHDIGQAGFSTSVEDCDAADSFIRREKENNVGAKEVNDD